MSADEFRVPVFGEEYWAQRLKVAAEHVLKNDFGIPCQVELAVSGFAPDERILVNGKPVDQATDEEAEAILKADTAVSAQEREAEATKYLDPASNPMIKLGNE